MTKVDKKTIRDKFKTILANKLGIQVSNIKNSSLLRDELGLDSFDSLRIVFEIEDEFGIKVPPHETSNIKTVNDVVDYISRRLNIMA